MGENIENFRDKLKLFAEISDTIENIDIFKDEDVQIRVNLDEKKYYSILKNFREIDWGSEKFFISMGNVNFKFVLKK